jgi:DNA-directed RNA polymerase subunit M/transcription elongation factor TFIIS
MNDIISKYGRITPLSIKFYDKKYNRLRRAKSIMFDGLFSQYDKYCNLPWNERDLLIYQLEKACLDTTIKKSREMNIPYIWTNDIFVEFYHSICYKISSNIDKTNEVKNPKLGEEILDKKISIQDLPSMSGIDLYPEKYETVIEKIERSKNVEKSKKTSKMYKCRRCHNNTCTIANRYNRSLDEGVNLTITCASCGFEWNG